MTAALPDLSFHPAWHAQLELAYALSLIHISEPTRLRCSSYAVFCLKKKSAPTTRSGTTGSTTTCSATSRRRSPSS
ncbi:hypothetical protein KZ847_15895, partial [Pseudomonas aeruginosa]